MRCLKAAAVVLGFVVYGTGVMWFNQITSGEGPTPWHTVQSPATLAREPEVAPTRHPHTAEMHFYDVQRR